MSVLDRSERAARRRTRLVLVTGMSGAGKSTVLKAFEDIGYEAVDNPPLPLLASLVGPDAARGAALVVDIDVRTRDFSADALRDAVAPIFARDDVDARLLFVDCEDEVLRRRFTETRRRHPLADDRPVIDGIRHERGLIEGLRAHADLTLDTTELGVAELRRLVAGHYALDDRPTLTISVVSFSYAKGLPREADLVFDVRFLTNPHYVDDLRPLTGRDAAVGAYIAQDPGYLPFFDSLAAMLVPLLPRFEGEARSYLTIAVGCTGGRHRSVYVAERVAELLGAEGRECHLRHRDLPSDPG